ncbi:contractile injection system tape measure protein [Chitinophaga filiformis]|uniref:Uncharacterized protein n=1 Tax=Chitinophaga filiformis TaxID=104663 RepID=A0A1G7P4E9_CHIFI|nr:contractile injection system tape measure protein [Chitinophaga filiformis]SDF80977.1 hypothetical protein SAMN04488121_1021053 [Chitinophaga filiformis]
MKQQHAIGKLLLEVQLPSREEAFALQGALSTGVTMELEPMLSALLDSWADPDTLLQIDKLEIDLGSCNLASLRDSLPEMIISHLRKHYSSMQSELTLEAGMQRIPLIQGYYESWLYFLERGILPSSAVKWQQPEWEAGILAALSSETYALQQCKVLFMEHPYAIRRLVLQFSPAFVRNWILAYSADAYRQVLQLIDEWETFIYHPQLREAAGALAPAQQQLIPVLPARTSYHDDIFIWLIREIIVPGRTVDNTALLQQLMQPLMSKAKEAIVPRLLFVLQKTTTAAVKAPVLLQQTAATLAMQYLPEITALQKSLFIAQQENERHKQGEKRDREDSAQRRQHDTTKDGPEQQEQASARKHREQERNDEQARRKKTAEEIKSDKASSIQEEEKAAAEEKEQKAREEREEGTAEQRAVDKEADLKKTALSSADEDTASPEPPAEGSVYYINNAGLILLHLYLSFFFDALELREEQQFKDEAAKHRAVQLLGYLAYGEEDIPEWDLVLPKILCGIQPAEPVRRFIPLTDTEKTEANELLAAVISHWNALGNTSPDGLRGNFLLREGKLEWKEEEWQLYVTQQAYDMLLNQLPWGFSVVGLSWMPWLIKTVWT